jgi:hypothetical protein
MLTINTDSYVTLAEAETYFLSRIDTAAWTAGTPEQKEQSLATAARMLNELIWVGVATSDSQLLAFPRNGEYLEPILGKVIQLNPAEVPRRIKDAQCEQAYHLLNNDGLLDNTGTVSKIKVDVIEISGLDSTTAPPPRVSVAAESTYYPLTMEGCSTLSRKYSSGGYGRTWWRAN